MIDLYTKLLDSKAFVHVACAGAGSSLITELWKTPGASTWLSGGTFLYGSDEMKDFIGYQPAKAVCEETAIHMAMRAYQQAYEWGRENPIGIGLTASVASTRIHRGEHQSIVAILTNNLCFTLYTTFEKRIGLEARGEDERECVARAIELIRDTLNEPNHLQCDITKEQLLDHALSYMTLSEHSWPVRVMDGWDAIYPGAFNPMHNGHLQLMEAVKRQTGRDCILEINVDSPHKGNLKAQDLLRRGKLCREHNLIVARGRPLYIDKARAYPGKPIVMGTDALDRMLNPDWGPNIQEMLNEFVYKTETKFLVNERIVNGKALKVEEVLQKNLGEGLDQNDAWITNLGPCCDEISSTEIRDGQNSSEG